jgi:hypothetical protein
MSDAERAARRSDLDLVGLVGEESHHLHALLGRQPRLLRKLRTWARARRAAHSAGWRQAHHSSARAGRGLWGGALGLRSMWCGAAPSRQLLAARAPSWRACLPSCGRGRTRVPTPSLAAQQSRPAEKGQSGARAAHTCDSRAAQHQPPPLSTAQHRPPPHGPRPSRHSRADAAHTGFQRRWRLVCGVPALATCRRSVGGSRARSRW